MILMFCSMHREGFVYFCQEAWVPYFITILCDVWQRRRAVLFFPAVPLMISVILRTCSMVKRCCRNPNWWSDKILFLLISGLNSLAKPQRRLSCEATSDTLCVSCNTRQQAYYMSTAPCSAMFPATGGLYTSNSLHGPQNHRRIQNAKEHFSNMYVQCPSMALHWCIFYWMESGSLL
jgi:hypothetical protein